MNNDYDFRSCVFDKVRKQLVPTTCDMCKTNGFHSKGNCSTCLRNIAKNIDYIETHLFIVDDDVRNYHTSVESHGVFKRLPLRMQGEKPYLYYGIELEVSFDYTIWYDDHDDTFELEDEAEQVLQKFTEITQGMFVYERDGSVDNGYELISRPTSYAKWTSPDMVSKLKRGLNYLKQNGASVRQPSGNGNHIHLSKRFFENSNRSTSDQYQDIKWFFDFYQDEIEVIGDRSYTQYCEGTKTKEVNILRDIGSGINIKKLEAEIDKWSSRIGYNDHMANVNSTDATVEVRVFRSTIDYKALLANIELVRNVAHAVRNATYVGKTLNDILHTKENKYLDGRIKEARDTYYKNTGKVLDLDKEAKSTMEFLVVDNELVSE